MVCDLKAMRCKIRVNSLDLELFTQAFKNSAQARIFVQGRHLKPRVAAYPIPFRQ